MRVWIDGLTAADLMPSFNLATISPYPGNVVLGVDARDEGVALAAQVTADEAIGFAAAWRAVADRLIEDEEARRVEG